VCIGPGTSEWEGGFPKKMCTGADVRYRTHKWVACRREANLWFVITVRVCYLLTSPRYEHPSQNMYRTENWSAPMLEYTTTTHLHRLFPIVSPLPSLSSHATQTPSPAQIKSLPHRIFVFANAAETSSAHGTSRKPVVCPFVCSLTCRLTCSFPRPLTCPFVIVRLASNPPPFVIVPLNDWVCPSVIVLLASNPPSSSPVSSLVCRFDKPTTHQSANGPQPPPPLIQPPSHSPFPTSPPSSSSTTSLSTNTNPAPLL